MKFNFNSLSEVFCFSFILLKIKKIIGYCKYIDKTKIKENTLKIEIKKKSKNKNQKFP